MQSFDRVIWARNGLQMMVQSTVVKSCLLSLYCFFWLQMLHVWQIGTQQLCSETWNYCPMGPFNGFLKMCKSWGCVGDCRDLHFGVGHEHWPLQRPHSWRSGEHQIRIWIRDCDAVWMDCGVKDNSPSRKLRFMPLSAGFGTIMSTKFYCLSLAGVWYIFWLFLETM